MDKATKKVVCYLTGAPASGKSTLCELVEKEHPDVKIFSYSRELRDHVNAKNGSSKLDETTIRQQSALAISKQDVEEVDRKLIEFVESNRQKHSIIIDSHPVTKENFGFRITGFDVNSLKKLSPDKIFCLYAPPEIISERIQLDSQGRPLPSMFELDLHTQTQAAVAAQYGILLGKTCYLLDGTKSRADVLEAFVRLSGLTG